MIHTTPRTQVYYLSVNISCMPRTARRNFGHSRLPTSSHVPPLHSLSRFPQPPCFLRARSPTTTSSALCCPFPFKTSQWHVYRKWKGPSCSCSPVVTDGSNAHHPNDHAISTTAPSYNGFKLWSNKSVPLKHQTHCLLW